MQQGAPVATRSQLQTYWSPARMAIILTGGLSRKYLMARQVCVVYRTICMIDDSVVLHTVLCCKCSVACPSPLPPVLQASKLGKGRF